MRGTSCRLCNASLISRNFDGLFTFILKKISIFIPEQLLLLLQLYEVFEPKFIEKYEMEMSGEELYKVFQPEFTENHEMSDEEEIKYFPHLSSIL